MEIVRADTLAKTYGRGPAAVQALKAASFRIDQGAFLAVVGPSGSGKTTLLNLIGCLAKPSGGRLQVAGRDVATLDRTEAARFRGQQIGFIFQNFNLIPVLTAYENVEYPLWMVQRLPAAERRRRVQEMLDAVGMREHQHHRPDQLSGGQKQRVAIARALVTRPALVLADEPTANLDGATARDILDLMQQIRRELQTTFIFSTHDERIIGRVETVYPMEDGVLHLPTPAGRI